MCVCVCGCVSTHTHTHTQRERERERERVVIYDTTAQTWLPTSHTSPHFTFQPETVISPRDKFDELQEIRSRHQRACVADVNKRPATQIRDDVMRSGRRQAALPFRHHQLMNRFHSSNPKLEDMALRQFLTGDKPGEKTPE